MITWLVAVNRKGGRGLRSEGVTHRVWGVMGPPGSAFSDAGGGEASEHRPPGAKGTFVPLAVVPCQPDNQTEEIFINKIIILNTNHNFR